MLIEKKSEKFCDQFLKLKFVPVLHRCNGSKNSTVIETYKSSIPAETYHFVLKFHLIHVMIHWKYVS